MTKKKSSAPVKLKPRPPRNLTPSLCEQVRREIFETCQQAAEKHGLKAEGGDLADVDLRHGFDIRLHIGIPQDDGTLFSHERALFEVLASSFGLEPNDYGRIFRIDGETYRITAINPNRPKYPISAERVADGRGYKFTADNIALYLTTVDK